jgi:hypothetical protein
MVVDGRDEQVCAGSTVAPGRPLVEALRGKGDRNGRDVQAEGGIQAEGEGVDFEAADLVLGELCGIESQVSGFGRKPQCQGQRSLLKGVFDEHPVRPA